MQGERIFDWKKMFLNVNIIAVFAGFILLLTQYRFPKPIQDAIYSLADMIGPVTMLICGILLASTKFSMITSYRSGSEFLYGKERKRRLCNMTVFIVLASENTFRGSFDTHPG